MSYKIFTEHNWKINRCLF